MTTLITGGSKCGKSSLAESIAVGFTGRKIYAATMRPFGGEAHTAIERHRLMRSGKGFETIEQYTDIDKITVTESCTVLIECLGNLCANEMFREDEIIYPADKIVSDIIKLRSRVTQLIIVTNEVGCDGESYGIGTQKYIAAMGEINRKTAEISDNVIECVYGIPVVVKGELPC